MNAKSESHHVLARSLGEQAVVIIGCNDDKKAVFLQMQATSVTPHPVPVIELRAGVNCPVR